MVIASQENRWVFGRIGVSKFAHIFAIMNSKAFNRFFYISLAVLAVIYGIGMTLDLMDVDSSTYALISKQMYQSGSYLQVFLNNNDYLDKPPLVFWATCLSFKIFGIHDWAYRLASVLVLALGIYSTYRYAKIFYSERAAKMAALIMASCFASYVMTSDVRTDTMLCGWVMFSIWQLAEYFKTLNTEGKGIQHLLLGGVGVGLAMLTKGPIGLIIPVTAFVVEFAYKRQWHRFFRWQYLIVIVVIAIILVPMSYGLYEQFDLHPEKVQYGRTGTSGLRFYYWTQSFGRITGESSWSNNPDPFFLFHSFLWSFAPWCVFFIPALYTEIRDKIKNFKKPDMSSEVISVGGFVLILIFLSRSKYQLPHYSFAIHPLAAVITAKYLDGCFTSGVKSKLFSAFYGIHVFLMFIIFAILFLIVFYIFPAPILFPIIISLSFCAFLYVLFLKTEVSKKVLLFTMIPYATLTLIFNTYFYPKVLTYQPGSYVTQILNKTAPDGSKLLVYRDYHGFSMQFYSRFPIAEFVDNKNLKTYMVPGKTFILADTAYIKEIQSVDPQISIIGRYNSHSPTLLSWGFLNPKTRNAHMDYRVLMKY